MSPIVSEYLLPFWNMSCCLKVLIFHFYLSIRTMVKKLKAFNQCSKLRLSVKVVRIVNMPGFDDRVEVQKLIKCYALTYLFVLFKIYLFRFSFIALHWFLLVNGLILWWYWVRTVMLVWNLLILMRPVLYLLVT